ncbi:MAG: glycosyltransferase [Acidimicrobiia bacterium]|nr:glycosyltransferase [Acidimicrobiia bacterium]
MRQHAARYDHLLSLIDDTGIFEHARYGVPRRDHGYVVDDAARAAVVLCEAPEGPGRRDALHTVLSFVINAQRPDGRFHNRLGYDRRWRDRVGSDDAAGRAMWALGVASARAPVPAWRAAARSALETAQLPRSSHLRPPAFAALGAHAMWRDRPDDTLAMGIMEQVAPRFNRLADPWPEARLTYANGRLPHAMLVVGEATNRPHVVDRALEMLAWLERVETRGEHYSFAPVGGWAPGEPRPGFDQQPIEAAAIASAAERAWKLTGDIRWRAAVLRAGRWLDGYNDARTPLYDPVTGACRDGLTSAGANQNLGAESTLAGLEVMHACTRVGLTPAPGAIGPNAAAEVHG